MSILPAFDFLQNVFLLFGGAESADHLDGDGKSREALLEGFEMLEGEDGGGRQDGDLFVVGDCFESRAHGDFRLAVADVAAEQAGPWAGTIPCRALRQRWPCPDLRFR